MGRFSVETSINNPQQAPYQQGGQQMLPSNWPTVFPKESIGIELPGVIVEEGEILTPGDIKIINNSLAALREIRLKGYKVFLFFNEPLISAGRLTSSDIDARNQHLMKIFGEAGIFSIDGLLYSTSTMKEDLFAFPNNGMLKKAENEFGLKFKGGYFISNNLNGLKAGSSSGARPILIKSNSFDLVQNKLETFANRELKTKTKTFNNLFDFANSLS